VRIADTLLRGGHLADDALAETWYTGERPAHLDTCTLCSERAIDMARWLEQTRDLGAAEADAAFTPERLAAQQSQILRKLEQLDRPAKLLSFPAAPIAGPAAPRRSAAPWIAAAAAAGLVLGVVAGRLSVWQPAPAASNAAVTKPAVEPAADAAPVERAADLVAEPFPGEIGQPELSSLSALESLTPQAVVARASNAPAGKAPRRP
jgi:hypothetical protein